MTLAVFTPAMASSRSSAMIDSRKGFVYIGAKAGSCFLKSLNNLYGKQQF